MAEGAGSAPGQYLDCGRLMGGVARIRCPGCRGEHLLAFSCRTRNLCSSCQSKRSALFAERLREELAAPVAHRHVVYTIPKALRGLFERERSLLGLLARAAWQTLRRVLGAAGEAQGVRRASVRGSRRAIYAARRRRSMRHAALHS